MSNDQLNQNQEKYTYNYKKCLESQRNPNNNRQSFTILTPIELLKILQREKNCTIFTHHIPTPHKIHGKSCEINMNN